MLKVGDTVKITGINPEDTYPYEVDEGVYNFVERDLQKVYTFDELFERFRPYLPENVTHTRITEGLTAYRSSTDYLSIKADGTELSYHLTHADKILNSRTAQVHIEEALKILDDFEKVIEVTMEEVAAKFNVPVTKLKIKGE